MVALSLMTLLGVAAIAAGSPLVTSSTTPAYCKAISSAVNKVKGLSTATPFCSSFLHISTITSTASSTTTRHAYETMRDSTAADEGQHGPGEHYCNHRHDYYNRFSFGLDSDSVDRCYNYDHDSVDYEDCDWNRHCESLLLVWTVYCTSQAICPSPRTKRDVINVITALHWLPDGAITTSIKTVTPALAERAAAASTSSSHTVSVPAALSSLVGSALSSACSCLNLPTPTIVSTTTLTAVKTSTVSSLTAATITSTPTSTATAVLVSTYIASETTIVTSNIAATSTITPSVTVTSTLTVSYTDCAPSCTVVNKPVPGQGGVTATYSDYFNGYAATENPSNPGNGDSSCPPITSYFDGSLAACDAINQCASTASGQTCGTYVVYDSFDVHHRISTGQWECVQYFNPSNDPGYFNVVDADVSYTYGYSLVAYG
ncbi:hypothetical protein LTR85_009352 [Meristemomyces frigidus]|nr:hypothetical protein LTR85_009352 [Meristemomyces frigidus]